MEPILLDTSVWVDALRGNTPDIVDAVKRLLNDDSVVTCGPVLFEIKRSIHPQERKKIMSLFDALTRLPTSEAVWDAAGDLDALLRKRGITIPPMDTIIAQISLHHKVPLFTLDKHFRSVPGLKLFEL